MDLFPYFKSKDDDLVHQLAATGVMIASDVGERPSAEAAWLVLRRGFDPLIEAMTSDPGALPIDLGNWLELATVVIEHPRE
jgi:hypothetical protein